MLRPAAAFAGLACLFLAACVGTGVEREQTASIKAPQTGVVYLDRCSREYKSTEIVLTKRYSFFQYDDGTLLIEVAADPREHSWIEKRAADFGIQIMDRTATDRGEREQTYEIGNLQAVRDLEPGARAEGKVSEKGPDGVTKDYDFLAEVQATVPIDHWTLGQVMAIPVRSIRLDPASGDKTIVIVFFDVQSGEVLRSISENDPGTREVCDRIKTNRQVKRPLGIKLPQPGIEYLARCDGSLFSSKPSEAVYTFRITEGDTLRTEFLRDEHPSWTEKRVADYGINIADQSNTYGEGFRKQVHELNGLDRVRKLLPGARAGGKVYEYESDHWFEYDLEVEVLHRVLISHTTLGVILAIPVETRRTWVSGGRTKKYVSYVDVNTGEIVQFYAEAATGYDRTCDLIPRDSRPASG